MHDKPVINCWTEFGDLEYICVGTALNSHYPEDSHHTGDEFLRGYIPKPLGPRPSERIKLANTQLEYLVEILQGENIQIGTLAEVDADIRKELARKRSFVESLPKGIEEDKRVSKKSIRICRPEANIFDHHISTPWFKNYYQVGNICPRDTIITLGNTILEAPTASASRYFESSCYRHLYSKYWEVDKRVHWKAAPKPSCGPSMFDSNVFKGTHSGSEMASSSYASSGYKTPLNETEIAFDAADLMRIGKDIFYKKSEGANNKGLDWLRREFPELRFHMMHFPASHGKHIDATMVPLRGPTSGTEGLILLNQTRPPLKSEVKLFEDNNWKLLWAPAPITNELSPVATCTPHLNMNLLSLSPNCVIIEECELPMYNFLEDIGFDVLTVPLRALNEFGGGVHCVTWDIRRNESCMDYFPNQDYDKECELNLEEFYDEAVCKKQ